MIQSVFTLPEPPQNVDDWDEISGGELSVKFGDAEPVVVPTTKEDQLTETREFTSDLFWAKQGLQSKAQFVYLDNADPPNRSKTPTELEFTVADTVPPVDPTALGVRMGAERPD